MPRFTKFLFGGVVGAGLALMLAPKTGREMRRMFMGGGRPALPPPQPSTAPAPGRTVAAGEVSLESRIEETRRQVESQLVSTAAEPAAPAEEALVEATEAAMIEEDFVVEEAPVEATEPPAAPEPEAAVPVEIPEAEAGLEAEPEPEAVAETEPEAEAEPEAEPALEFPSEEAEAALADEELAVAQDESAAAEEISRQQEAEIEVEQEASGRFPTGQTLAELAQEHDRAEEAGEAESGEFDALKTPAEGEPTIEEVQPAAEPPREPEPERPQPSRLDQDEMRRRINETRDRLKAKAFDAMVSGETFIETEADKARKHGKPDSPELEDEVEKQIEESLKEEY